MYLILLLVGILKSSRQLFSGSALPRVIYRECGSTRKCANDTFLLQQGKKKESPKDRRL